MGQGVAGQAMERGKMGQSADKEGLATNSGAKRDGAERGKHQAGASERVGGGEATQDRQKRFRKGLRQG